MDRGLFDPLGVAVAAEFGEVNGSAAARDAATSPPPVRSPEAEPDVEDEDEDEAECRVCRGEAEPDRRLFAPCKCSGSIRFTHSDCLEQWLEHSGKTYCELCGHQFEFKPLYDANAPDVLPWSELCGTMLRIAFFKWLPFGVRAALVLVLWLAVAPWCTSWLYRMWLLRASAMINVNFSERFDAPHVVADIFSGIILIVCVVFSFLALMSFADFLRFHLDHIEEHMDDNHANNHAHHHHHHHHHHRNRNREVIPQAVREANERELAAANDVPVLAENARDADPRLQENFNELDGGLRPLGNLDEADSDDSSDEEEWGGRNEQEVHDNLREERPRLFEDAFIDHPLEMGMEHHMEPVLGLRHRRGARNDQVEGANEVIAQANEEPLARAEQAERAEPAEPANAAVPPRRNVRDRPNNAGPRAANANREWEDDFEHMEINIAMDELLGLRGDIVVLFRNVSWLLAFNGAYLGLFAFIPYTLGSTLLSAGANIVAAVPFSFSSSLLALIAATSDDETAMGAVDSKNIDTSMPIFSFTIQTLWRVVEGAKARGDCLQLVDICTCATGYFAICCTIVLWRFMVTTASSYIHRPLMGGLLWALRCLTAIVKVSTLLLLKMVVLPIVLGLGIDFATLHLFKVTPHERVAFCLNQMVGSLMVHWVLGITFMLFVTVAVLQLREVVHPDLLAKVIRPQEDHPDLLRTLLSEKCTKHARRMVLSLAIYAALLVVIVHIPVRLACLAAPSLLPLTLRFQYLSPEIQVPLELLAVHLVVLSVLEHAKNDIGKFQHSAIAFASKHFGLTGYLLPRIYMERTVRDPTLNIRRRVREEFVLAPPPLHFHPRAQLPPEELRVDGQRYLPWPEEGLDDPEPTEYDLLPRRKPTNLSLRLSGLVLFSWAVSVLVVGAFLFGSLAVGRLCLAPFERVTGISHDPLVMAAGVEIVWLAVNGVQALQVLTRPIDQVAPDLVQRGYAIRNLTPSNAVTSVVGWAFASPLLLGHSLSKCFPTAQSSWLESYMMGILLLNLTCWLVCTVRNRRRGAGRRDGNDRRNANMEFDDAFIPDEDEEMEMEEDFLDDEDDEDLFDDEDDAEDEDEVLAHDAVADGVVHVDRDNFVKCLRKSYRQLRFTLAVHESEVLRMRQDPIGDNCFDVGFFQDRVLWPIVAFLFGMLIAPTFASSLMVIIVGPSPGSKLEQTAFAISALVLGAAYLLVRAHAFVSRWIANVCESIRNERYLIGRQLQDMAR